MPGTWWRVALPCLNSNVLGCISRMKPSSYILTSRMLPRTSLWHSVHAYYMFCVNLVLSHQELSAWHLIWNLLVMPFQCSLPWGTLQRHHVIVCCIRVTENAVWLMAAIALPVRQGVLKVARAMMKGKVTMITSILTPIMSIVIVLGNHLNVIMSKVLVVTFVTPRG